MLVWNFTVGNAYMFLWNYFFKTLVKLDHFCKEAMKLHIYLYLRTVTCFLLGLWTMSINTVSILSKSLCVKSVPIRTFFWSVFCHIWTRKNSVFGHFSRSVTACQFFSVSTLATSICKLLKCKQNFKSTWWVAKY